MNQKKTGYLPEDAGWVVRIRDIAGAVALIGVGILGGFTLTNLRPGWAWLRSENNTEPGLPNQK